MHENDFNETRESLITLEETENKTKNECDFIADVLCMIWDALVCGLWLEETHISKPTGTNASHFTKRVNTIFLHRKKNTAREHVASTVQINRIACN